MTTPCCSDVVCLQIDNVDVYFCSDLPKRFFFTNTGSSIWVDMRTWPCQERKTSYQSLTLTIYFWRKGVLWASFGTDDFLFAFMKVLKFCKGHLPPKMCVWETRLWTTEKGFSEKWEQQLDMIHSSMLQPLWSSSLKFVKRCAVPCVGKIFRALCVWYLRCWVSRLWSSHCLFSIVHLDLSMVCAKVEGPDSNVLEFLVKYI